MGVIFDGAALAEVLRGPRGPVARHLIQRATVVQAAARHQAPRRTNCLAESIVKRPVIEDPVGLAIEIVSDTTPCSPSRTSYSLYVHEGTDPHPIIAKPGGVLSFMWQGQQIFVRSVQHPGTKPNRFLSNQLPLAIV